MATTTTSSTKRHKPALSLDANWFTFCGLLSPQRARLTQAIVAANGHVTASLRALPTHDVPHGVVYVITDYWVEALPVPPRTHSASALTLVFVTEFWLSEMLRTREWLDVDAHVFFTPPPRSAGTLLRFAYPDDYAVRMGVDDSDNSSSTSGNDKASKLLMHMPCAPTHCYREQVPFWPYYVAFLHMPMRTVQELATVLKSISGTDPRRELTSLEIAVNDMLSPAQRALFFSTVLPEMARLVLQLPSLFASRPHVLGPFFSDDNSSSSSAAPQSASAVLHEQNVAFTKREALALVSSCFFGVFPSQNRRVAVDTPDATDDVDLDFPYFTMRPLFQSSRRSGDAALKAQKLRCVLAYFLRVVPLAMSDDANDQARLDTEVVTFTRIGISLPPTAASPLVMAPSDVLATLAPPAVRNNDAALTMTPVRCEAQLLIEDLAHHVQIDFANKFAGGGVFNSGCVQEEIRFLLSPELFIACLVFAKLEPHEAFVIHGSERFANYRGYGGSFEFAGDFVDTADMATFDSGEDAGRPSTASGAGTTTTPPLRRRQCVIIGIDAVDYGGVSAARQYARPHIWRDVVKAYVGFAYADASARAWPVATGNWGCGVFRGDAELKFLIQWLAASLAQRELVYVLFERDQALHDSITALLSVLDAVVDDSDRERVPLLIVQFLWSLDATLTRRAAALRNAGKRAPRPSVLAQARDYLETQLQGLKRLKLSPSPPTVAAAAAAVRSQEPLASPSAPLSSSSATEPVRATDDAIETAERRATGAVTLSRARGQQVSSPARTSSPPPPHREPKSLQQQSITQFFHAK